MAAPPPVGDSVLVVNAGSSSLKVKAYPAGVRLHVERIGERGGHTHETALEECLARLAGEGGDYAPAVVGHRVVHGGTRYTAPTVVDDEVEAGIAALCDLAPLHNPANLAALRAARRLLPRATHVAVFDTAFHATLPRRAYLYGLPLAYAERGLRRYGFHGTSHDYVTREAARLLGRRREELRIVSLHLGNGASGAAVDRGEVVDTSMGLTPLEGLLMGTRSGDVDPGLILHLLREGMSPSELDDLLNRRSGLAGMSGVGNDMRDVRAAAARGSDAAAAALEVYVYRVRKLVGAYAAAMGGLDAVVFTGGVGENDPATRAAALEGLGFLGIELDPAANAAGGPLASAPDSRVAVLVLETDEEVMIAAQAVEVARRAGGTPS